MSAKLVPSSSQTVGPYFRIGLEYLAGCAPFRCFLLLLRHLPPPRHPAPGGRQAVSATSGAWNVAPFFDPADLSD